MSTNSDGSDVGRKKWELPKNALRRMRNGKSAYESAPKENIPEPDAFQTADESDKNPYSPEALAKNPYLGWQPKPVPPNGPSFSIRECFKADPKSDGSDQPGKFIVIQSLVLRCHVLF